jgi:hypothetical protein
VNFLYPQFLFGLLAVSIPIIIHLFNLQKPKKVFFPNVKFLKEVQQSTSNKLRLKHLLILLSRISFLIFLVLAFAQPFLASKDAEKLQGKSLVSLFLDNSFSMQNELAQEKALDVSIKSIQQLTELFPNTTSYGLLSNDFEGKDQYFRNKEKLHERISEINFSNTYRDAAAILKRQHQLMAAQGSDNKHVIWFSDFQKSTLGDLATLPLDSTVHYHWVPVQNTDIANVAIDSLWLENPFVKNSENNTLHVKVHNYGALEVRELTLKLYIDQVQVSSVVVDIAPQASVQTAFVFTVQGEGQKKASIRFEDYPIVFDNAYYLTLNVSPKIQILNLYDKEEHFVSNVYAHEAIFEADNSRSGDFDYSKIGRTNLIVLNNLKNISPALLKPLADFVREGGSLVVLPSAEADRASYEALAQQLHLSKPESVKSDTTSKTMTELLAPDFGNPFFSNIFDRKDTRMTMPFAYPVVDWGKRGVPLLKYKNNQPYLLSVASGRGTIYLFAAPLTDAVTNMHRHSFFVPLMYKIAFNSITAGEKLAYSFQEPNLAVNIESDKHTQAANAVYTLEAEDFKMIPSQWRSGAQLMLQLPAESMKAGFYELKRDGVTEKIIALNYGQEELAQLAAAHKNIKLYNIESGEQFADSFRQGNIGTPLWKYCLIGALLFLLVEILLIRFWK